MRRKACSINSLSCDFKFLAEGGSHAKFTVIIREELLVEEEICLVGELASTK